MLGGYKLNMVRMCLKSINETVNESILNKAMREHVDILRYSYLWVSIRPPEKSPTTIYGVATEGKVTDTEQ